MESKLSTARKQPHAVCMPFPAQGHINPMTQLAKILHSRGFHITFVHTHYNYKRLIRSRGPESVAGLPSFRFETISDGLCPPSAEVVVDATQDPTQMCLSVPTNCTQPFRELIQRLNFDASAVFKTDQASSVPPPPPPVSCIISDHCMHFALEVAQEFGVPGVLFCTYGACGFMGFNKYRSLIEQGITPLKDESYMSNGYLDAFTEWIPTITDMRLKDIPTFIRTTNPEDVFLNFMLRKMENCKKATAIIFNTYDALEQDILANLAPDFPPLYSVGPLQFINLYKDDQETLSMPSCSLWKDDPKCLEWLDTKESRSVVYVSFGSITTMSNDHLVELAWGLANSKKPFLWIMRPDLVQGESSVLPQEFIKETSDRGLIASWCEQKKVLSHPAIGGFLTHSGWNSTLESICGGVAMLCWPFFAEQNTNCWYCCNQWGIGMEMNNDVKRSEVERQVIELMDGKKGEEMKRKAMEWKRLAEEATTPPTGSSYLNLENLIYQVLIN